MTASAPPAAFPCERAGTTRRKGGSGIDLAADATRLANRLRDALTSIPVTRQSGTSLNAALICLARRRCDVILAMLRTGQPYRAGQSRAADLIAA